MICTDDIPINPAVKFLILNNAILTTGYLAFLSINTNTVNSKKQPEIMPAIADNPNSVKSINVKVNKKLKLNLLYDKDRSLVKRIKIEQIRKNTK